MRKTALISKYLFLFIITLGLSIFGINKAYSQGFLPQNSSAIYYYGIGLYAVQKEIDIYSSPDNNSPVKEIISIDKRGFNSESGLSPRQAFVAYLPQKRLGFLSVMDENDNWYEIAYNEQNGFKGWIKKENDDCFLSWAEFLKSYGMDKGVYFFNDMPAEFKNIRTNPSESAQIVKNINYCNENDIKLNFVSGNWLLATFNDFDNSVHIGWIRWRDDNGKVFVFPNLTSD